jgi:hypothetical protein
LKQTVSQLNCWVQNMTINSEHRIFD